MVLTNPLQTNDLILVGESEGNTIDGEANIVEDESTIHVDDDFKTTLEGTPLSTIKDAYDSYHVNNPKVSSQEQYDIQHLNSSSSYNLPFSHNRGKPQYSPDVEGKRSKHPIAN